MTSPEPYIARRTCTEINPSTPDAQRAAESREESQPIENFAQEGAFVLLGAPGSGKTEEFKRQAKLLDGHYVSARNFLALANQPELRSKTLFIDGLDEVRAGVQDGRTPFDAIRNKLQQLDRPRFRLSCREADWFGSNDRLYLESVAPNQKLRVLRLNSLSATNVREILRIKFELSDPDEFIEQAEQRGVQALLENPLSLRLLVKAVRKNEWPKSRSETFEMACRTLAKEDNRDHLQAIPNRSSQDDILRAAGRLCAIQLLAGAQGIKRLPGSETENDDCIDLSEISGVSRSLTLESLGTRIFDSREEVIASPIHRQIAEFLGARYLAKLVCDGLPPGRILALMSGFDGMIVTELRGLGAWLAALNEPVREELIERDPLGIVLYGDVARFSKENKLQILKSLKRIGEKNPWFIGTMKFDSRLRDLITADLEDEILAFLDNPSRDFDQQSILRFLVETLIYAEPFDDLAPRLIGIIRDESLWTEIRRSAIKAFLRQRRDENAALAELKELMKDIINGSVSDLDNDLLGRLLGETYPMVLPGTEVLDYLREHKANQAYSYQRFWMWNLLDRTNCEQIAILLDQLAIQYQPHPKSMRQSGQRNRIPMRVPLILLDRFLSNCQEIEMRPQRLFQWLGVAGRVGDWNQDLGYLHEQRKRIRSWLGDQPKLWKTLLAFGLENSVNTSRHSDESDFQQLMWMEEDRRLFGAKRPLDFADWCLDKAACVEHSEAASWLMRRVADAVDDENISRTFVDSRIEGRDVLKKAFEKRLSERKQFKSWETKQKERERKEERREEKDISQWQMMVRDHRAKLIENRAPIHLLRSLAIAYFGGYDGMSEYLPRERLSIFLGGEDELVEAALIGLCRVVMHQDLPSVNDVVKLGAERKTQYLWFPFLAGFNELSQPNQDYDFIPGENQKKLAFALYFNVDFWQNPWGAGDTELQPTWLRTMLEEKPGLAADVLIDSITAKLRNRMNVTDRLYEFAYEEEYQEIARLASLPILDSIPIRSTKQQLSGLRYLFIAAYRYCQRDSFVELIKKKLTSRSMSVVARVYWLAAGFLASPADYIELLQRYVHGNKRRITYLADFIGGRFESGPNQSEIASAPVLSSLILLLGAEYPPRSFVSGIDSNAGNYGRATRAMDISFRIENFIRQLMRDPSPQASEELERLEGENSLVSWGTQIQYAIHQQKDIRREAIFEHAEVSRILRVLQNLQPANPADLTALTMDHLSKFAQQTRDGNESGWKEYWILDRYDRPIEPKPENACRRTLLLNLQQRFVPLNVDTRHEVHCADDKRADIGVSFDRFNIPIEIKRSCHPDLWTAIKTQLIPRYTRDPDSDGHGIYLIFWFGNHKKCQPTSDASPPPKRAAELQRRLEESLTDAERRKISVCVIDVEDRKNQMEPESSSHGQ